MTNNRDRLVSRQVIITEERPSVIIGNNSFETDDKVWRARLDKNKKKLEAVIPSVGRIEVKNHPLYPWVGTGWLVAENVVITNRHVALHFGMRKGDKFISRINSSTHEKIQARIDFREEHMQSGEAEFNITDILYIEPDNGPDIAFLQVKGDLPNPISLAKAIDLKHGDDVVTVGYPGSDNISEEERELIMEKVYGNVYDVKRLLPGKIMNNFGNYFTHDCSTLPGSSGSVVLDLNSGEAVGIHYGGKYLEKNYAIPASIIRERLKKIGVSLI